MREFSRTVTGPKQGVYSLRWARSAHRNASTNPYSPSDSPSDSSPWGGRGTAPVDSAIAVDLAGAVYGLPSYKACNGLGGLRQSRGGSNREGLSRESNA
jgi:hypothetical protein